MVNLIKTIIEGMRFKPHPHIKVSGNGVISTTSTHIISTKQYRDNHEKLKEMIDNGYFH